MPVVLDYEGQVRQVGSNVYVEYRKAGTAKQSLKFKLDPAGLYAEFAKLNSKAMQATESKASARKTSRALSNITAF